MTDRTDEDEERKQNPESGSDSVDSDPSDAKNDTPSSPSTDSGDESSLRCKPDYMFESDTTEEPDDDADDEVPPDLEPKTDGEGYPHDRSGDNVDEVDIPDPDEDTGLFSTPPDDEEMPLGDHIEEMILRFAVVLLVGAAATAIGLLWASEVIEYIWLGVFPGEAAEIPPPHVYHPLELWMTRIKVAMLAGILVALPMFIYQCYLFMRPGLYPHERKYYLSAIPLSVVLAGLGMLFSYFLVLPILFRYFTFYSEGSAVIAYALGETFNLIITLTGILAIVFQIPLFIMLAIMMGVTTRRWLAEKRLYFWAAFFAISFMFTVDPTMMAPILVALIMILLFEGTLALLKWTDRS